jgi:chaperonin cofactor prefoldin
MMDDFMLEGSLYVDTKKVLIKELLKKVEGLESKIERIERMLEKVSPRFLDV